MTNELDPITANRLISGQIAPADAPAGYAGVAALVERMSTANQERMSMEKQERMSTENQERMSTANPVVAAMIAARQEVAVPARAGGGVFFRAKFVAVAMMAMMLGMTGLAFAGALPPPAQRVASVVLAKLGMHVPNPDHPSVTTSPTPSHGQGTEISDIAKTTSPGPDHGATVSGEASDGHSQAGEDHGNGGGNAGGNDQGNGNAYGNGGGNDQGNGNAYGNGGGNGGGNDQGTSGETSGTQGNEQ